MDLDHNLKPYLAKYFFREYLKEMKIPSNIKLDSIFNYYKSYRANVRTKVLALNYAQNPSKKMMRYNLKELENYIGLLQRYCHS